MTLILKIFIGTNEEQISTGYLRLYKMVPREICHNELWCSKD